MLDVAALGLAPGDVRRVDVPIEMDPLRFGGETYDVDVPGGRLQVKWCDGGQVLLTGPAVLVAEGEWRRSVASGEYRRDSR